MFIKNCGLDNLFYHDEASYKQDQNRSNIELFVRDYKYNQMKSFNSTYEATLKQISNQSNIK